MTAGPYPNSPSSPEPPDPTREGLEQLRKRLLDLTRRNKLLNFRHSAKSSLRVVDELPDQLFKHLKEDTKLTFRPVPYPKTKPEPKSDPPTLPLIVDAPNREQVAELPRKISAKENAANLGIRTSYDLPEIGNEENPRHFDKVIQTLQYPDDLEAILRRIGASARTALEESGTNMLYLVFGFLEWYESADSTDPLYAPLLTLPVELNRAKPSRAFGGMFEFSIEDTGEDLLTNLSLVERMKRDFALTIPMLENDDTPERYFKKFSEILTSQPRWGIRRQITLTLLQFGKLLMFLDLDLSRNPCLLSHARVRELLGGPSQNESSSYGEVYELDQPDNAQDLPRIIYDADSSQHSALIDALRGRNLVIEGPPGTGKSQTITNLIAASMVQGKSVLFVSEKLAALEVVRRRLDQAGLGHFCLELHSHKTKKDKLLQDIQQRMQKQRSFRDPESLEDKIRLLERNKKELVQYVNLINQPFGSLRKTIFDIIWKRDICLQNNLFFESFADQLALPHAAHLTPSEQEHQCLLVDIFQQQLALLLENCSSVAAHPWSGINANLNYIQEKAIIDKIEGLKTCLRLTQAKALSLLKMTDVSLEVTFGALQRVCKIQSLLPKPTGSELFDLLSRLKASDSRNVVQQFLESLDSLERDREGLTKIFTEPPSLNDHTEDLQRYLDQIQSIGIGAETKAGLSTLAARTREFHGTLKKVSAFFGQVTQHLASTYPCTIETLRSLAEVFEFLSRTNFDILYLRNQIIGNSRYTQIRNKAQNEAQAIGNLTAHLSQSFLLSRLPSSDELWKHASTVSSASLLDRWFSAAYKAARNCYQSLSKQGENVDWSVMAADFKELAGYQDRLKAFASNVQYQEAFGSLYAGLATPFDEIAQLQGWYADLYIRLRPSAQPLIDALETLPSETLRFLSIQAEQNAPIVGLLRTLAAEADGLPFDRRAIGNLRNDTSIADLTIELGRVATILQETVEALGPVHFREHVTVETMSSALEHATTFRNVEQQLNHDGNVSALLGRGYCGCQTGREGLKVTLGLIDNVCCDSVPTGIQNWLLTEEYSTRVSVLDEHLQSLNDHLSQYWTLWVDFMEFAQLDEQVWYGSPKGEWKDLSLEMVCTRLDRALIDPLALSVWLEYVRSRKTLEDAYLPTIISLAEQGQLKPAELQAAYDFSIYNGLSSLILKTFPMLLSFSRSRHEKIRDQFVKLDNQLLDLNRQRAAYEISRRKVPSGTGNGPVRDYTDRALLEHEIQKQRGHIPIRALINRAHLALLGLKPCFMMGPMSVAQYLEPGKFHFDLIVMDEASQLKPEDALGAIARGSQVIIVGDPKQLPPTSFFDMMFVEQNGTEEEDDSLAIEDSESILDRASEIYRPIRQLRWHYRSRHESLIAFSNHRFYDQNLILFPSPQRNSSSLGIKFHFVQEGVYSSRTNRPEADQLVQAILAHMANHPNESLGVATFNTTQRDLIEALLYEKVKNDPVAQAYEAKWKDEAEPFFIKNLETVQGDERDCIFISFTYGRDEKGVMYQRFGPINGTNGHRRLNVLFTRSKLRTEVFTSMQPEDINVGSESSLGLKALRGYLVYAKTGVLEQAELGIGPEPNDFELAVGNALKTRGLDIVAQVGVAGYFIDLAVCHPKKQGSYILGVECDGATYHSAKSARDRDRLRQSNLENMGWRIHRVWSTDWLRNRSAEVERIAQLVHNILRAEELMHN